MKTIRVHRAEGLHDVLVVEPVTLEIHDEIPKAPTLDAAREFYRADAAKLQEALRALPQGTRHELLLLELHAAGNLYRGA